MNEPAALPRLSWLRPRARRSNLIHRSDEAALDAEYRHGRWDYLAGLPEMPRYAVIAGYCRQAAERPSVLDLGCGSGILLKWLESGPLARYVGVDKSGAAIEIADRLGSDRARFMVGDATAMTFDETFSAIVLNEVLYYFERPSDVVRRCASLLEPGGLIVISLWDSRDSDRAWQETAATLDVIGSVRVAHDDGLSWRIRACVLRA